MPNVVDRRHSDESSQEGTASTTPSEAPEELSPEARLLSKLAKWLIAQPEYPQIFLMDRTQRRQFSKKAATLISTIPKLSIRR